MPGKPLVYKPNLRREKKCKPLGLLASMQRLNWAVPLILTAFACSSEDAFHARAGAGEEKTLRISIVRSGGFAGITMRGTVDEKDLSADEAQKLRQLVEESDFFNLPRKIVSRVPQPDRFQYELRIEENGQHHTVTVSDEAMPAKLKPLIKWLMGKARKTKKGKESP
jgi:hypothetical protein